MNLRNPSPTKEEKYHTLHTILLCENIICQFHHHPLIISTHRHSPDPDSTRFPCRSLIFWGRTIEISGVFPRYPTIISSKYSLRCYNSASPLISHRIRYSGEGLASELSSFFRRYTREEYISEPLRGFVSAL